eukprot:1784606-Pleurochrysis_carterae.AAC.1
MATACVDKVLSRIPRYAGSGSRAGRAYFRWNPVNTFVSALDALLTAMQGDMSQHVFDASAVLGFLRNQIFLYRRRNPLSPLVPTAAVTPGASADAQGRGASATGQTKVCQQCIAGPTSADRLYPFDR